MIDPLERWRELGLPDKPDYAGLLTYAGLPYTQDPADLEGVDVAIVGAPMDDLTSDRPGTRFGPRAIRAAGCPPGPHLEAGVDAMAELRVIDFGDAPVVPSDPAGSHAAIERTVGQVVAAGVIPIVLGGDHSIAEPDVKAVAAVHGPVALVHFDTHTDTGEEVFGVEVSHGTPMYRLVRDGHVDGARYVQIGLRGYWPGEKEFGWQAEHGITSFFMHDVRDRGIRAIVEETIAIVGDGPAFLTRGRRRARPGVRTGDGHARARWDDERRPALGVPRARLAPPDRGDGRGRGDPDRRRVDRRHGARRRADRPRGVDRYRPQARQYPGSEASRLVQLQTSWCATIPTLRHESASRLGKPVRIPCLHAYQAPSGSDLGGWVATQLPTTPAR